jgi:hypothetical protein
MSDQYSAWLARWQAMQVARPGPQAADPAWVSAWAGDQRHPAVAHAESAGRDHRTHGTNLWGIVGSPDEVADQDLMGDAFDDDTASDRMAAEPSTAPYASPGIGIGAMWQRAGIDGYKGDQVRDKFVEEWLRPSPLAEQLMSGTYAPPPQTIDKAEGVPMTAREAMDAAGWTLADHLGNEHHMTGEVTPVPWKMYEAAEDAAEKAGGQAFAHGIQSHTGSAATVELKPHSTGGQEILTPRTDRLTDDFYSQTNRPIPAAVVSHLDLRGACQPVSGHISDAHQASRLAQQPDACAPTGRTRDPRGAGFERPAMPGPGFDSSLGKHYAGLTRAAPGERR